MKQKIEGGENTYYRVDDHCEQPMIFETVEEAIEYLTACLEGINYECGISIEKVQMTRNQFNQLPEGL